MRTVNQKEKYKYYKVGDHYELFDVYSRPLGRFSTKKAVLEFLDILQIQDNINAIPEVERNNKGR